MSREEFFTIMAVGKGCKFQFQILLGVEEKAEPSCTKGCSKNEPMFLP